MRPDAPTSAPATTSVYALGAPCTNITNPAIDAATPEYELRSENHHRHVGAANRDDEKDAEEQRHTEHEAESPNRSPRHRADQPTHHR